MNRPKQLRTWLVAAAALSSAGFAAPAKAQNADVPPAPAVATAMRLTQQAGAAHLEIDLSTQLPLRAFVLENPDRVIIDLPNTGFLMEEPNLLRRRGLVKGFHSGLFAKDHSRIVIDLTQPAKINAARVEPASGKSTALLVLDLQKTDRAAFHVAVQPDVTPPAPEIALRPGDGGQAAPQAVPQPAPADALPLVVIDPGHGGPDAGATGIGGVLEKNTVFNFATVLKSKLEASHRYRVMLTRDQDVFVPLAERMRIARAANADLFLSLHADTLSSIQSVAGATVYTVSDRASDAEAARIAAHENAADQAGGLIVATQAPEVADILTDLTRRETRSYAHVFSKSLVNAWKNGPFLSLNKNPQRSAGFVVLKAPDVPSVLLELGYLSSTSDAKALNSDGWRDSASASVLKAIDSFFTNRSLLKKVEDDPATPDLTPTASIPRVEPK